MSVVKFYYKGELKATAPLPEATMSKDRLNIASALGVYRYDRMQFISNGIVRMDTDEIKDKRFLYHELSD